MSWNEIALFVFGVVVGATLPTLYFVVYIRQLKKYAKDKHKIEIFGTRIMIFTNEEYGKNMSFIRANHAEQSTKHMRHLIKIMKQFLRLGPENWNSPGSYSSDYKPTDADTKSFAIIVKNYLMNVVRHYR